MNDDTLFKSRTAWASIVGIAGTQLDAYKALPSTLQVGIIAIVCTYILGRSFQKGLATLGKK